MKVDSKVSVIIPIYNVAKYLPQCLDSILHQTHQNLEIICVNDGSTDNSTIILQKYAKKDSRIKLFNQKNQGQSSARNLGIQKSTGDYIGFIDADDTVDPQFIEKLLSPYQNNPKTSLTACGFFRKYLNTDQIETMYLSPISPRQKSDTFKSYILRLLIIDGRLYSSVNKLYRAEHVKKISFDQTLDFAEDTRFVLDYLQHTNGQIVYIPEPLYIYNFGSVNSTINKSALKWQNWQKSYQDLKSWVDKTSSLKEKLYLKLILIRWRISFYRSKARARKSQL